MAATSSNKPKIKTDLTGSRKTTSTTPGPLPAITDNAGSSEKVSNPTQYVYQYGIKNIELSHSLYNETGIYVTKPIEVEGNIVEVGLSTFEEHPLFNELGGMATDRVTSVEYYITTEENPSLNDWVAILPEETKVIKSEKLFFSGQSATLRFPAIISDTERTHVYRNNMVLNDADWYFTERGAAIQLAVPLDKNSLYTIDYVPNSALTDPWNVKVGDRAAKIVRQVDVFRNGADMNNTVKLSKYPYVNYTLLNNLNGFDPNGSEYRPVDVLLKDATIATSGGGIAKSFFPEAFGQSEFTTKNRTDYKNSKDVRLKPYSIIPEDVYQTVEYKQEKNKLVFTESFNRSDLYFNQATNHGNAKIEVQYSYLVTNFRLKVILRKNTGDDLVVTPTVNSYQLKFKVMK